MALQGCRHAGTLPTAVGTWESSQETYSEQVVTRKEPKKEEERTPKSIRNKTSGNRKGFC